jgi:hypothetical protein
MSAPLIICITVKTSTGSFKKYFFIYHLITHVSLASHFIWESNKHKLITYIILLWKLPYEWKCNSWWNCDKTLEETTKHRSRNRNSQFGLFGPVLRATTTAVWMAAPVQNILDTPSYIQFTYLSNRQATGWTVLGSNPGGGEIFRTCPDRPWGPHSFQYNGTGYREYKAVGAWRWPLNLYYSLGLKTQ